MRFMTRRLLAIAFAAVSIAVVGAQQAQTPPGGQGDRIGPVVTQLDAPPDDVRTLVEARFAGLRARSRPFAEAR